MSDDDRDIENGLDPLIPGVRERTNILYKIRQELSKESDRGCALVAAAYLENEMSNLLERFFIKQSKTATEALFEFNGPVGTFSSKIKMAYALGLISLEIHNALDLVRKIRNKFAHLQEPLDFQVQPIKQMIDEILPNVKPSVITPKELFISKILSIAAAVHLYLSNTYNREAPSYEDVTVKENRDELELDIAARRLMKITCPEITYEEALEFAKEIKKIKIE